MNRNLFKLKSSKKSTRKYPNVIWFPRSKTDPREIREVLKLALLAQEANPSGFFNDKILGEKMARIGSINVIGLSGEEYIEQYEGKNTANVSYITNARMLMRLFRFLGFVTRLSKGKYILTDLGRLYCTFNGDFPSYYNKVSEEKVLLDSLSNFGFYSVNDDSTFRDIKFRIRPFYWLLYNLSIEPQCIFQLIVTTFASSSEGSEEIKRIKSLLSNLRLNKTNLKNEWKKVGLAPDDYSCVHNFYDSAKILVYLGTSIGLICKISDPIYGKKISGNARHLKQATTFYALTEKGKQFVQDNSNKKLIYYDELYDVFNDKSIIDIVFLLAALNYKIGNKKVVSVSKSLFKNDISESLKKLKLKFEIEITSDGDFFSLKTLISFSFYQSVPPEIMHLEEMKSLYNNLINGMDNSDMVITIEVDHAPMVASLEYKPYFELDSARQYTPPNKLISKNLEQIVKYAEKDIIFGGSDRFSNRVSPTNSIIDQDNVIFIDNSTDALDLLVPLRLKDSNLVTFIENNTVDLVSTFINRSDIWEKDQHYLWVRNCFRHFGMEATYSGSGGMLSRADVTVIKPFIAGIEAKSPRENRGTLNTKAVRQAVDAKIQVADKLKSEKNISKTAIAIGRRISNLAISEERKWANEKQPVLLMTDAILHYLILKSASINFSEKSLIKFFTKNHGTLNQENILALFRENTNNNSYLRKVEKELKLLSHYLNSED